MKKTSVCSPGHGTKPAFRQKKIKENHNIKSKFAPKLYYENIWQVNIIQRVIFQSFIYWTGFDVYIFAKFCCFANPVASNIEAKSVVPKLTTKDSALLTVLIMLCCSTGLTMKLPPIFAEQLWQKCCSNQQFTLVHEQNKIFLWILIMSKKFISQMVLCFTLTLVLPR